MKTITLTEEAYERLSAWKQSRKDSFSKVVNRVVPRRGDLGNALATLKSLPPLSPKQLGEIEKELQDLNDWSKQADPWST